MAKKFRMTNPIISIQTPYTAEQQETIFKKEYEFNKGVPSRSSVTGWENKYITEGNSSAPPKEIALIKGSPHKFKHVRTGNIYSARKAIKRSK